MVSFLKLPNVKVQLNIDHDLDDDRISNLMSSAEAIVLDYLKVDASAFLVGSPAQLSLPKHIEAAMVLVLEALYDGEGDPLTVAVTSILARSRDPTLA